MALVCFAAVGCADVPDHARRARGARALEGRLLAPCCWVQTLDVHESELATALRAEITERALRGESPEEIEDDLVVRYGQRIRAIRSGRDPRRSIAAMLAMAMVASMLGLVLLGRRWTRARVPAALRVRADPPPEVRDPYAEQLERELEQLDRA